jgi:Domain of unknown function (DUF4209)
VSLVDFDLLPEHLEACDWRSVIESCSARDCRDYSFALHRRLSDPGAELSPADAAALRYIGGVCAGMLTPEKTEPFAPMIVMANGRSALPSDLNDSEVELLRWLVANAADPELRARAADYLWFLRRDYEMAETAIEAYFESAAGLERAQKWSAAVTRLSRAVRLAAHLGKNGEPFRKALARVETIAARRDEAVPDGFAASILDLVLSFGGGDPAAFAEHARLRAERAEAAGRPFVARSYWRMAAKWHERGADLTARGDALTRLAETYVQEAESALALQPPNHMAAASHFQHAIEAFRRFAGNRGRVAELMGRMEEAQLKSRDQLKRISTSFDVSEIVETARAHVRGKPLLEALVKLGLGSPPTKKATVREQVIDLSQKAPLQFLISLTVVDGSSRNVARRGPVRGDQSDYEEALEAEMLRHAGYYQVVTASSFVEPARQQIWSEHPCEERDLAPLVSENPFVPPGHEYLFIRGLHAGLTGDFLQSTHVLGLQLENSLRHVLNTNGVRTTTLQNEIQSEMTLDTLLAMPECSAIFGEDVVFDLRALLTEGFGSNLRHRLAHGLMSDAEFQGPLDSYLWWLILHLCCGQFVARLKATAAIGAPSDPLAPEESAALESSTPESAEEPPPVENGGKNGTSG